MTGAFPFKAARPKGAKPASSPPSMSFEMPPQPPPPPEDHGDKPAQEIVFEQSTDPEDFKPQEEDMAKKRRGRPPKAASAPRSKIAAKFTFAEVVEVLGEDVPFVKVLSRIVPVIEVLPPADRVKVVEILGRLFT